MSDTPCLDSTDNILGQEFLTWLWYQSDVAPGAFVEVLHTFELTDGLFLNVNTRDGSLPATFDMSDNLVPTTGNAFQLGRFL